MGLTNRKEEQLRKQPILEAFVRKSEDGKYLIHKTVITQIRPVAYYQTVIDNEGLEVQEEEA